MAFELARPLVWLLPATSFLATSLCLWWLLKSRLARLVLDNPNARSLHAVPVPRTGGLAIMLGALPFGLAWILPLPVAVAVLALVAVSFRDDMAGVPVGWRLGIQGVAAAVAVAALFPVATAWWWLAAIPITVWMINLYNFMDGADGVAGGMALFGFSAYGVAALMADAPWAGWSFSIAAAAAGFLCFNFPPARVFMGDAGSIPLGFLAAFLGWMGWSQSVWPLWFPVLAFSPFVVDASVTLVKRTLRREKILQAHREHYYQRLVLMGWSHARLVRWEFLLMAAAGASAVWGLMLGPSGRFALFAAWATGYGITMTTIDRNWARFSAREERC